MLHQEEIFLIERELNRLVDLKQQVANPNCPYFKEVVKQIILMEDALGRRTH